MNLKSLKTQFVLWIKNIGFGTRESGFASPFLTKKVQFNSIHKDLYLKPSTLQIIKGLMVILLEVYITQFFSESTKRGESLGRPEFQNIKILQL